MPHPLQSRTDNDSRVISTKVGGSTSEDKHALAYRVISSVSVLDAWRQELFVHLLGGPKSIAAATYLSLQTRGPKTSAINSAAEVALSVAGHERFTKIISSSKCLESYRDKLAHWQEYHVRREKELCLADPRKSSTMSKPISVEIYVFPVSEMKDYLNYAVHLSVIQDEFLEIVQKDMKAKSAQFSRIDQRLQALAMERQRL